MTHQDKDNNWRSVWISRNKYVDIDTGELIGKQELENYIIIKIKKYAKRSKYGTGGIKYITNECKRNPYKQQKLFDQTP